MTPEQIKEIEREALELFPCKHGDNPDWYIAMNDRQYGYKRGATAQLEKFPCSPEEAREAIRMAKSLFNIVESHRNYKSKIAGLETELTVWKDTADKFKRENDELKETNGRIAQNFAALQIRLGESETKLQQRDELLDKFEVTIRMVKGGFTMDDLRLSEKVHECITDYQKLRK